MKESIFSQWKVLGEPKPLPTAPKSGNLWSCIGTSDGAFDITTAPAIGKTTHKGIVALVRLEDYVNLIPDGDSKETIESIRAAIQKAQAS